MECRRGGGGAIPFNRPSKVNIQSRPVRQRAAGLQWKNEEEMEDDGEEMTQNEGILGFTGFSGRAALQHMLLVSHLVWTSSITAN